MSSESKIPPNEARSAAEWFVALDADGGRRDDARAAAWLDESADHSDGLARCATAVAIARGLADDPELRWAYDEAAAIARGDVAGVARGRARAWVAWSGAGLAAAAVGAAAIVWSLRAPAPTRPVHERLIASRAAEIVASSLGATPAVLLSGGVAVDANSVAVLPFAGGDGAAGAVADFASLLQQSIVADLAMIPGMYVVGGAAVQPFASPDLSAAQIGALLGSRGVMSGNVERVANRVRVHAELTDAATNRVIWHADYEGSADELRAIRTELVDGVAATLVDPVLRRSALNASAVNARADNALASIVEPASDR